MKLYELKEAYENLLEMQDDMDISEYLKTVEDEIEEKFQNIGLLIKSVDAEAEAIKAEEKKLAERRKVLENKRNNLKEWLYQEMASMDIKKINKPNIVLSIAKNPPKLVVSDDLVPEQYKVSTVSVTIDKTRLKDDLKAGLKVNGAELIQETSLRIK